MPVQSCESNGKPGYRWGTTGKCYTYEEGDDSGAGEAKQKAFLQGVAMGDTEKMSGTEIEAARLVSDHYAIRVAKDASGNAIIAWFPFDGDDDDDDDFAKQLALPYGVAPEDLHLTLLYLGDPTLYDIDLVAAVTKIFTVASYYGPCEGCVTGIGRFVGDGDEDIIVALCDVPWLDQLRCALQDQLSYSCALPWDSPVYASDHGFLPHITLAYVPRTQSSPAPYSETIPFCIDSLTLAAGSYRATFDMYSAYADTASADSTAYYAAREIVAKAGRVLSTKNHSLVTAAIDALSALHESACDGRCDPEDMEKAALHLAEIEKAAATRKPKAQASMYNADGSKKTETDEEDPEGPNGAPAKKAELKGDGDLEYFIQKQNTEDRYTFGPLYAPARKDAHDEYTDAETLQKALWGYVQDCIDRGDNRINLQHDDSGDATVGRWVEASTWPYETTIKVAVPGEETRELTMPAGTVYMGVVWDERAWEEGIKKKRITGYSLGGRAVRVNEGESDLLSMGDKLAQLQAQPAAKQVAAEEETVLRQAEHERELALASDMGAVAAERNVLRTMSDRLLSVLERHASTGVTINENGTALTALLEE